MSTSNGPSESKSSLPTFTSIHGKQDRRSSHAESSNASLSRSANRDRRKSNQDDDHRHSLSAGAGENEKRRDINTSHGDGTVKRLKRSSGGFLLDSSPSSSRLSRSLLSRGSLKGKEKPDERLTPLPKSRNQLDGPGSASSARGSLLSADFRSSPIDRARGEGSVHSSRNTPDASNQDGSIHSYRSSDKGQPLPSFGFESDPAQIVDMALRLSEARRLQVAAKRYASSGTPSRRIVSNATSPPSKSPPSNRTFPNGSLNPIARPKPLSPEPVTPQRTKRDANDHAVGKSPVVEDAFSPEQDAANVDRDMQISRATLNRVTKAKAYFELAYEHRRLLPYLPPIRPPDVPFQPDKLGFDSKVYNPLQYARNRKLRFRERHPINSEVEGWHDVDKVRAWVDAVVGSTPTTHHDPLQCIRLPPLTLVEEDVKEPSDEDENADSPARRRHTKIRRPKSDWVTHPGDLIADAFWTEQGLNKKKIYNRDNEPIYPPGTKFMFSGWRDRAPLDIPEEFKSSSPGNSPVQNKKLIDSPPELPAFESAHKDHSWARTKSKFGKTLRRDSKRRSHRKDQEIFHTSDGSSDSSMSASDHKRERGRRRLLRGQAKLALTDGDPFARPIQSGERADSAGRSSELGVQDGDRGRGSMDRASLLQYLHRGSTSTAGFTDEGEKVQPLLRRKFLETIKLDTEYAGRSSYEYDSTAPGTPTDNGFPSIAINLSPPDSRSPSPLRRNSSSFLGGIKDKALGTMNSREQRDDKNHVDRTDFAQPISHTSSRSRSAFSHYRSKSRTASPMTRGISPGDAYHRSSSIDEPMAFTLEPRGSNVSKVSSRATDHSHRHHRVRGMFKGGRIAELVGNEVTRVGDFIWKRDAPRRSMIDSGSISGYETESDDYSDHLMEKPNPRTRKRGSRMSRTNSQSSMRSVSPSAKSPKFPSTATTASAGTAPQYHVQGLPSFTSPFQRDEAHQKKRSVAQSPGGTPILEAKHEEADPVSQGNAASRAGRSPRLDRLAPPRLDVQPATPEGRRKSYGFGGEANLSRTQSASQSFNGALNGYRPRESTRLSSLALPIPFFNISDDSSQLDLSLIRTQSSMKAKRVTKQDYTRLRGLLVSVAIKATNISAYCEEIPRPQSAFLYSAFETTGASGSEMDRSLPAQRRQEHALAARHLIGHLHQQSGEFSDRLNYFTSTITVGLQREMQMLEDKTESSLFPRLQRLSDEAGQLAQKLTTTSTLAVRMVQDEMSEAARMKRRGPFRISRGLWFKLAEWGVVGLLWGIWAVVTSIKVGLGVCRAAWAIVAWLLWLR